MTRARRTLIVLVVLCAMATAVTPGVSPVDGAPEWSAGYFADWEGTVPNREDIYNFISGAGCWGYGLAASFAFGPFGAGALGGSCWLITYA
jgi:hypothetical protein